LFNFILTFVAVAVVIVVIVIVVGVKIIIFTIVITLIIITIIIMIAAASVSSSLLAVVTAMQQCRLLACQLLQHNLPFFFRLCKLCLSRLICESFDHHNMHTKL